MRRLTILVGLAAAVALMVPAPVAAQTTVYDYDDGAAWWNTYNCADMKILLPAWTDADGTGSGTAAETRAAHEKRVCVMYADLATSNKLIIETFIEATDEKMKATHKAWWDAQTVQHRQVLAGALALRALTGDGNAYDVALPAAATAGAATAFDPAYDSLGGLAKQVVDRAGNALSGRGGMMTDDDDDDMDEAPALPIFATLLLGGVLAGRGWWLRRCA